MFTNLLNNPAAQRVLLKLPIKPIVLGFIFKDYKAGYYKVEGLGYTPRRLHAHLFHMDEIAAVIKKRGAQTTWGHKGSGHWITVYAPLPAMNCHS